jgi:hypothetical protein
MAGPLGGGVRESKSAHHQCLETSMVDPLEGIVGLEDPGAPTINRLEISTAGPWEVMPKDPRAPTVNA